MILFGYGERLNRFLSRYTIEIHDKTACSKLYKTLVALCFFLVLLVVSRAAFSQSEQCDPQNVTSTPAYYAAGVQWNVPLLNDFKATTPEQFFNLAWEVLTAASQSEIGRYNPHQGYTIINHWYEDLGFLDGLKQKREFTLHISRQYDSGTIIHYEYDAYYNTNVSQSSCPIGYTYFAGSCKLQDANFVDCPSVFKPDKNRGKANECVANPVSLDTLTKWQVENDYTDSISLGGFTYNRFYNGPIANADAITPGIWTNSFSSVLSSSIILDADAVKAFTAVPTDHHYASLYRDDGQVEYFKLLPAQQPVPVDPNTLLRLSHTSNYSQWQVITEDDDVELYDSTGRLLSITSREGNIQSFVYDDDMNTLMITNEQTGEVILLTYDAVNNDQIIQMQDPDGLVYRYAYNADGMLEYVSYPDTTNNVSGSNPFGEDNPYRQYHYEDSNIPSALTGITDERNIRYATWEYDAIGRVVSSEHDESSGIDNITLDYADIDDPNDSRVLTKNALDKDTVYHFSIINGERTVIEVEGVSHTNLDGLTCAAANQYTSYDINGFKDIAVDWKGQATDYDHDDQGRETQRIEGVAASVDTNTNPPTITINTPHPPEARTISTKWHPDFRLPTRITEEDKITDISYDCSDGRVLQRSEWPPASAPAYTAPDCS